MEDAHVAQLNLEGKKDSAFFGVFDGHQSDEAARYCRSHMLDSFMKALNLFGDDYKAAFEETFKSIDEEICQKFPSSGAAANCVFLHRRKIVCANAGDCRAVLCREGKPVQLSFDHKPKNPDEETRIVRAGAQVENGRINMELAVSRAVGDTYFKLNDKLSWKEQAVTAAPDVTVTTLHSTDQFIVIACDGIWDVLSNEECCALLKKLLDTYTTNLPDEQTPDISLVCEHVLDHCLAQSGTAEVGNDNMSIIVVQFKPPFFQ